MQGAFFQAACTQYIELRLHDPHVKSFTALDSHSKKAHWIWHNLFVYEEFWANSQLAFDDIDTSLATIKQQIDGLKSDVPCWIPQCQGSWCAFFDDVNQRVRHLMDMNARLRRHIGVDNARTCHNHTDVVHTSCGHPCLSYTFSEPRHPFDATLKIDAMWSRLTELSDNLNTVRGRPRRDDAARTAALKTVDTCFPLLCNAFGVNMAMISGTRWTCTGARCTLLRSLWDRIPKVSSLKAGRPMSAAQSA